MNLACEVRLLRPRSSSRRLEKASKVLKVVVMFSFISPPSKPCFSPNFVHKKAQTQKKYFDSENSEILHKIENFSRNDTGSGRGPSSVPFSSLRLFQYIIRWYTDLYPDPTQGPCPWFPEFFNFLSHESSSTFGRLPTWHHNVWVFVSMFSPFLIKPATNKDKTILAQKSK